MIELNAEDVKAVIGGAKQLLYTDAAMKKGVEAKKEAKKKTQARKRDKTSTAQI